MRCVLRKNLPDRRRAFSLLEVVISLLLIAIVMVVALQTLTAATRGRTANGNRAQALLLAHELLQEILEQPYLEPDDDADFGPESGEDSDGSRAAFDDVDDYAGWSASPPQNRDGSVGPVSDQWQRSVAIQWVQPNSLCLSSPKDAGVKQVVVTVERNGAVLAELSAVVTESRQVLPSEGP